jgi:putative transposase
MRWKSHVRFGRRAAETGRSRDRHRAAARPHTEHPTGECRLYCCAIKDVHSSRIVGYSMDSRMTASLAVAALRNAIALRGPAGTIVHSDRGSQGGFNWSSQHLDREVWRWPMEGGNSRFACIGGRSRHRADRRWHGGKTAPSSGRRFLVA